VVDSHARSYETAASGYIVTASYCLSMSEA
jgi:hypothetical protein